MIKDIVNWIKSYADNSNIDTLVIGISGGIDSALVSTLCAMTGLKTIVISMPIHQNKDQLVRAKKHSEWLKSIFENVSYIEKDLSNIFDSFRDIFNIDEITDLSLANTRSRLRMITLYQIAGSKGGIVVGTGNKIEDFGVGFFTKYGDGGVDISPIADLTKTQVRELSKEIGIIEDIIVAKPTDGLWEVERTDEDQLGATYEELEWAMSYNKDPLLLEGRHKEVYDIYHKFNKQNKHKMVDIPIFKILNNFDNINLIKTYDNN